MVIAVEYLTLVQPTDEVEEQAIFRAMVQRTALPPGARLRPAFRARPCVLDCVDWCVCFSDQQLWSEIHGAIHSLGFHVIMPRRRCSRLSGRVNLQGRHELFRATAANEGSSPYNSSRSHTDSNPCARWFSPNRRGRRWCRQCTTSSYCTVTGNKAFAAAFWTLGF